MKKNKFLPIAIILLGLINTGCQNKNTLENNKNITIGTSMKLEKATRDEYNYDTLSSGISELPLVSKNTDGTFSPLLVDNTTSDSKIWTLTLNDNYRWSDGNNVTAEDILFSLEYEWDNNTPLFSNSNEKGEFETYSISEDNKSISLTLEKANIKYLDNLTTFRIRPKHIYNNKNTDEIIELKKLNLETYNQALDYLRRLLELQRKSVKHKGSHSKPINLFFLSIKNTIISKINITNNLIIFTIIKLIYNINIIII